ncbi:ATP-grasp domain-containing protein [Buttiauxella sp. WJP83]|uniref:ATP-grasp domain-containing protein n=1 Tax=Buttiauxella sp. WJP83 TaxID=2986951 RepID=UPI0022DDE142|nr:ATP-grasp domain-containing protein [Buttiauxella sp. WJP83]WBM72182.1 ATP-grasp domain-containing protein [Buttiauxella sp. WJP83]
MRKNILVFPCGSEVGLEIHKSLNFSTHFMLFGGSSVSDHGAFVYKNYIDTIPFVDDPGFIEKLNRIIEEKKIDFIIPAHDSVVLRLSQESAAGRLQCKVVTSSLSACEITRSKRKTYDFFKDSIPTPHVYKVGQLPDHYALPVFLKPDIGQGSKGTHLANSLADIDFYLHKDPTLMVIEYLPGKEFTIDCFTDRNGTLLFSEARERVRISNGISVSSVVVHDIRFAQLAKTINRMISLRGAWFFQVKENAENELVLMEIATRIAGTMGLARCKGVNLVLLSLFDAMDYDIDIFENNQTVIIDRALENKYKHNINYRHVYLDFDDLVIFENKVNPVIMAFVYQCINKNIQIHLLTKHQGNLDASLKKYRLESVFDNIICLNKDDAKHNYIKQNDAIFIDDSFAERKAVHDNCQIPVFDSHMIESLMEKF